MTAIGIALLVVGVVVILVEAHVPSMGILGGPGVVALSAGAVLAVAGLGGGPEGTVLVDGALWSAHPSLPDGEEIHEGDRVVVERVSGLTLAVRKAEEWELVA
jgi:membrane-bound serine protease (ClpP class)